MTPSAPPASFHIDRTFNAPRDLVWKAWTQREQLLQWFGPKGFTMTTATLDFRPGGIFHYCLRSPDGKEMWGKFVYQEINPQTKVSLINSFSDKDGNLTRHPFAPNWPREMLATTLFTEHDHKTTIHLTWIPINASPEEITTFNTSHAGMNEGWTGTFDQLEAYLANA